MADSSAEPSLEQLLRDRPTDVFSRVDLITDHLRDLPDPAQTIAGWQMSDDEIDRAFYRWLDYTGALQPMLDAEQLRRELYHDWANGSSYVDWCKNLYLLWGRALELLADPRVASSTIDQWIASNPMSGQRLLQMHNAGYVAFSEGIENEDPELREQIIEIMFSQIVDDPRAAQVFLRRGEWEQMLLVSVQQAMGFETFEEAARYWSGIAEIAAMPTREPNRPELDHGSEPLRLPDASDLGPDGSELSI